MEAKIQANNPLELCEIDPSSSLSLMDGVLFHARENMLLKTGIVLPHVVLVSDSQIGMVSLPLGPRGGEKAIEETKRQMPKFLEERNAERAAVVHQATYRPIPMLSGATLTPASDDPNAEEVIIVEAADINDHWIMIQPFYRGQHGTVVFDEPGHLSAARMTSQSDLFLRGVNFKGKRVEKKVRNLVEAARVGKVGRVKQLLSAGANVNGHDPNDVSALMAACFGGYLNIVKLLLRKGAEVDGSKRDGSTPLMFAAREGHVEIVNLLIDHGADVNAVTYRGHTALSVALGKGHADIADFLVKAGAKKT